MKLFKNILRITLGIALLYVGISHLTFLRTQFLAQVPKWLPFEPDLIVVLSGIVEIILGLSLILLNKQKKLIGFLTAIFFVLIFPGNISQYVNQIDAFGLNTDAARFTRLFFQPVLILWAIWSTDALKKRKKLFNKNGE